MTRNGKPPIAPKVQYSGGSSAREAATNSDGDADADPPARAQQDREQRVRRHLQSHGGLRRRSVVVTVRAMHMAMRDLFLGRGPHAGHLEVEAQRLAGERMVAVQKDRGTLDLRDGEGLLRPVLVAPVAAGRPASRPAGTRSWGWCAPAARRVRRRRPAAAGGASLRSPRPGRPARPRSSAACSRSRRAGRPSGRGCPR